MRRLAAALAVLPGLALAAPDGQQIALHGNANGALPCAACHGVNGEGKSAIGAPRLAGLPVGAIEGSLQRFAAGDGGNAMMQSIAHALSPAEMQAVAAYFSAK
jgi:cytochrome c553